MERGHISFQGLATRLESERLATVLPSVVPNSGSMFRSKLLAGNHLYSCFRSMTGHLLDRRFGEQVAVSLSFLPVAVSEGGTFM